MKALALISGGLDSALAAYLIKSQGIKVQGISFDTKFTSPRVAELAKSLGIPIRVVDISRSFLNVLKFPRHGFGKNINPCIDCHIFMLKKCRSLLKKEKASFVITGEVLGQRPMSQRKDALRLVEKQCGLEGILLRPLSAQLLPETAVEAKGWVDRQKLLDIQGKGRKRQLSLAKKINLKGFSAPAGGCLLTDPCFSRRLKDLMQNDKNFTTNDIGTLKTGRHFRLNKNTKLIMGRSYEENLKLKKLKKSHDVFFTPTGNNRGPDAILRSKRFDAGIVELAKSLIVYYYKNEGRDIFSMIVYKQGKKEICSVAGKAEKNLIEKLIIK